MSGARRLVLWFGTPPSAETTLEFERRDLDLSIVTADTLTDQLLIGACGAVYSVTGTSLRDIRLATPGTLPQMADHGLQTLFVAENDSIQGYLPDVIDPLNVQPPPLCKTAIPGHAIAEQIARHDPGPARSTTLEIGPSDIAANLTAVDRLLLDRAFTDCLRLDLRPLEGGLTASVFVVYATFRDSLVGPRPLPFFAKLGTRQKIQIEIEWYRLYAVHFIPFHLRPNLEPSRCLLGGERGILVGNFVDRSESLALLARRGQAGPAIHSLFDVTLAGWRAQAFTDAAAPISSPIAGAMRSFFDYRRVQPDYVERARALGVEATPQELWELLIGLPDQCYRSAPMHGDLHGENVRVRGADAILIDLASVTSGPLAADPASLEVSLAFDHVAADPSFDEGHWRAAVDTLYSVEALKRVQPPKFENEAGAALWNSVRHVRQVGLIDQLCANAYATAVAVCLLRRTMYAREDDQEQACRAYAYATAARLIEALAAEARAT